MGRRVSSLQQWQVPGADRGQAGKLAYIMTMVEHTLRGAPRWDTICLNIFAQCVEDRCGEMESRGEIKVCLFGCALIGQLNLSPEASRSSGDSGTLHHVDLMASSFITSNSGVQIGCIRTPKRQQISPSTVP